MERLRVILVDDEPLARDALRVELGRHADAEVVAECRNGHEAVAAVDELHPDLVFLDVQMPEMDGLAVVREIGVERMPPVVFVTAFDRYALKAFEVHAIDYLLKPFDQERFDEAYRAARRRVEERRAGTLNRRLLEMLGDKVERASPLQRLEIKLAGRSTLVDVDEIDWIEAANSYVRIHAGAACHLLRATISGMEGRLDGERFVRIHRSAIVNVDRVREFQPIDHGDYEVVLRCGKRLRASRSRREALLRRLRG